MAQRSTTGRTLLRAYVDETGDRGCGPKASTYFAFACVLVADEDDAVLRAAIAQLRTDFGVPGTLHWNEHVKKFERRQHARRTLSALTALRVVYVLVEKAAIPPGAAMLTDHSIFYNYAAGFVLERALLAARDWPGGARDVVVRFSHVKGFDHGRTQDYFEVKRRTGPAWIPWDLLSGGEVRFEGQATRDGLQVADLYAGMLHAAIRRDPFGGYEPQHFLEVRPQLRRETRGGAWGFGFKVLGDPETFTSMPWWPLEGL